MSKVKQVRGLVGLLGALGGAAGAVASLRAAKGEKDRLLFVNAAASAVAAGTGVLIAVRKLKKGGQA